MNFTDKRLQTIKEVIEKMKNKRIFILLMIIIVLIAFVLTFGKAYAKYILTKNLEIKFASQPFYFEATTNITSANLLQGSFTVILNINNYNNNGFNNEDINYTISIKETDKFIISNKDTSLTRTLKGGNNVSDKVSLRIAGVPHVQLESIETLTFVVTSTSPYSKTIELPIKITLPSIASGYANDYRGVEISDTTYNDTTEADFKRLYGDNNSDFEYDEDGSIVLDENNAIPVFDRTSRNYINGYSVYITIKGDIHQWPVPPTGYDAKGNPLYDAWGPATIFAMSDVDTAGSNRLCWFGFRNGYFQIYSYCSDTFNNVDGEKKDVDGFRSIKMDEEYDNKILNIQITGIHDGITNVYFNGKLFTSFPSGNGNGSFNTAVVGDLRPLRGLKFTGNFYDIAVYNRILTSDEIQKNWFYADYTWGIE